MRSLDVEWKNERNTKNFFTRAKLTTRLFDLKLFKNKFFSLNFYFFYKFVKFTNNLSKFSRITPGIHDL